MATSLEADPAEFLRLAGHPLRWRLLGELARSDRTVHELTERAGEAQNLVSYHLAKLRDAGLVSARRSSADGRDAYYTVDLDRFGALLVAAGAAVHPGLHLAPLPAPRGNGPAAQVLFLCTGNSARSQMAEALARARAGGTVDAYSAGSRPKALHPDAVRVMREEHGIDIGGHQPKHLGEFAERRFDRVITLCDRVREVCPEFPGGPQTIHWSIPDPTAGASGYAAFQQTAKELDTRVGYLLAAVTSPTTPQEER